MKKDIVLTLSITEMKSIAYVLYHHGLGDNWDGKLIKEDANAARTATDKIIDALKGN